MSLVLGTLQLMSKLDGQEISPGVFLVGEPTPRPGTDKLVCLADVGGAFCFVELRLKFGETVAVKKE